MEDVAAAEKPLRTQLLISERKETLHWGSLLLTSIKILRITGVGVYSKAEW